MIIMILLESRIYTTLYFGNDIYDNHAVTYCPISYNTIYVDSPEIHSINVSKSEFEINHRCADDFL